MIKYLFLFGDNALHVDKLTRKRGCSRLGVPHICYLADTARYPGTTPFRVCRFAITMVLAFVCYVLSLPQLHNILYLLQG